MSLKWRCLFSVTLLIGPKVQADLCHQANSIKNRHDIEKVINKAPAKPEESPFAFACQNPELLKNRPKTGITVRTIAEKDHQGRSSREFFRKIIVKARAKVEASRNQAANVTFCISQETNPQCSELHGWMKKTLPTKVKEARYHLSLAQSDQELKSWVGIASDKVNSSLDSLGSYKHVEWGPLTPKEQETARKVLKDYQEEIRQESKARSQRKDLKPDGKSRFENETLIGARYEHFKNYREIVAKYPIIQHLKNPESTLSDINIAFESMRKMLDEESAQLDEFEKMLSQKGEIPQNTLNLLNYRSMVEEILLEDESDCGLATSLMHNKSDIELGYVLATALPIMAVSFFVPPAGALLAGVGVGSAFAVGSQSKFKDDQVRALGSIYGDELGQDLNQLEASYKQRNLDVVTMPIGYGLTGLGVRYLNLGVKSFVTSKKIFKPFPAKPGA